MTDDNIKHVNQTTFLHFQTTVSKHAYLNKPLQHHNCSSHPRERPPLL